MTEIFVTDGDKIVSFVGELSGFERILTCSHISKEENMPSFIKFYRELRTEFSPPLLIDKLEVFIYIEEIKYAMSFRTFLLYCNRIKNPLNHNFEIKEIWFK